MLNLDRYPSKTEFIRLKTDITEKKQSLKIGNIGFIGIWLHEKKKYLTVSFLFGFILTLTIIFSVRHFSFSKQTNSLGIQDSSSVSSLIDDQALPGVPQDLKTVGILLLGYGGAGHDGGFLMDAIQILFLDFENKKLALISIPRDLWIRSAGGEAKINSVLSSILKTRQDSRIADNVKKLISDISGININYFIAVDFVGIQRIIGINLKGIDVQVAETLDDRWYPISGEELNTCGLTGAEIAKLTQQYSGFDLEKQFPCRYEHIHFDKGTVHMEGGDALKYIRSRHGSAQGDISRGQRQQEVLIAIAKKLFSLNALDDIPAIFDALVKNVVTDINIETAKYIGPLLVTFKDLEVKRVNLSTTNVLTQSKSGGGAAILIPKEGVGRWSKIRSFIQDQIY